ncbi:MAG: carboxypeptidase-like regulatory domain-containing protein [Bacteroidales bacterium]
MNVGSKKRYIIHYLLLVVALLLTASNSYLSAQATVLDEPVTVRMSNVSISGVLKSITRKTGYEFTYDTDLVKQDSIISLSSIDTPVRTVLDAIFGMGYLSYTVIGQHIILYRDPDASKAMITEEGRESVYQISGRVTEKGSGDPLPYATLGLYRIGKGTVTNFDGQFSFKVTDEDMNDSLRISYLGFRNMVVPVNKVIGTNYIFELEREFISIPEVIIRARDPVDLIRNLRRNIPENYGTSPALMTAFYRESISRRTKLQEYSEAVINVYKSPYARTIQSDQASLFKSRKIVTTDRSDTLAIKLKAGLNACLTLDGIKNLFDFFREEDMENYDYRIVDIVSFDDEAAFVIEFKQKESIVGYPLFMGTVYVNTDNYGLHAAEIEINEKYISEMDEQFIPNNSKEYNIKVRKVKYRVDYRYLNGRYYLNHVRGDLEFFARQRKNIFGSPYYIFFELATTSIDTINVSRFDRNQTIPLQAVFSDIITEYDPEFWGTDNFLKPEDNIEEAINRINVRLARFEQ